MDDVDEFDAMVTGMKSLKEKLGTPEEAEKKGKKKGAKDKDGMKQTKLNFKKKDKAANGSPKKKKGKISDSEDDIDLSGNDSDFALSKSPAVKERFSSRRVAAKPVKYKIDSDSEKSSDDGEPDLFDNDAVKEKSIVHERIDTSDSEMDIAPAAKNMSSEDMFDSLISKYMFNFLIDKYKYQL